MGAGMLRRAVSSFFRHGAALWALMLGAAAAIPATPPGAVAHGRARSRSSAGRAGSRRLASMNISASHSSSVRKLQRAQRIRDRLGEG